MAEPEKANFQVPPELRSLAEQGVEQAKRTFDGFMEATQRAVSTIEGQSMAAQAAARQLQQTAVSFAERNVAASFEFAQSLLRARNPEDVAKLHAEYVRAQVTALNEQAREIGEQAAKAASARGPRQ
jgi:phasin